MPLSELLVRRFSPFRPAPLSVCDDICSNGYTFYDAATRYHLHLIRTHTHSLRWIKLQYGKQIIYAGFIREIQLKL